MLLRARDALAKVDPLLSSVDAIQNQSGGVHTTSDTLSSDADAPVTSLATATNYLANTDPAYVDVAYYNSLIDDANTNFYAADHVAEDAIGAGTHSVTVKKRGRSWRGVITATDSVNDLAVVRVRSKIAQPLWQTPDDSIAPSPGDQLLLVGSVRDELS